MRIRRRPQPPPSDPATTSASPSQTPWNADAARNRGCLDGDDDEEEGRLHANVDLVGQKSGVARRLALPQDNAVDSGVSVGAGQGVVGDDVLLHMRCSTVIENGRHGWDQKDSVTCTGAKPEPAAEEHASSCALGPVDPAAAGVAKDEAKASNSIKKRRGPAVLLEGSRCSRVNGRGWRCSQPTLVGYSLCEHHLGKGRMTRGGPGQLGRTEHRARSRVLPASEVTVAAAAPNAEGGAIITPLLK